MRDQLTSRTITDGISVGSADPPVSLVMSVSNFTFFLVISVRRCGTQKHIHKVS